MRARLVAVALLIPFAVLPSADAQYAAPSVEVRAYAPTDPLTPEVEVAEVKIVVQVTCPAFYVSTEPVTVRLRVAEIPAWSTMMLNPESQSQTFQINECLPSAVRSFTFRAHVSVSRDAPAYFDGTYSVRASVHQPSLVNPQNAEAGAEFTIKNDYLPLVIVQPASTSVAVGPGHRSVFPVDVMNMGNGPTRVNVQVEPSDVAMPAGVRPPPDVRLETKAGKGPEAMYRQTSLIDFVAPREEGVYGFAARFRSTYDGAGEALLSDESVVVFSILVDESIKSSPQDYDAQGPLGTAPMPSWPLLALALAGAAIWRRQ